MTPIHWLVGLLSLALIIVCETTVRWKAKQ